jgi:hypothetical protein
MNYRVLSCFLGVATAASALASDYRQSVGVGVLHLSRVTISGRVAGAEDPPLTPRTNREYTDGFNRVDSSGNLGEGAPGLPSRTSNFGFTSNSQVDLQRGTLALHAIGPGETNYFERSSGRSDPGIELVYRVVRERPGATRPGATRLGLELRTGHLDLDYASSDTLTSTVRVLTDTYALGGVVPQPAPYTGSFTVQPGTQRIGDTPTRSISTVAASVQGRREFSARGWLLRLGGVWEPIHSERAALQLHAGPALLRLKGSFRFDERWVSTGSPTLVQAGGGETSKWLVGGYAGVTGTVRVSQAWEIFGGADLLHADTFKVSNTAGAARFDFSRSLLLNLGIAFRF